MANSPDTPDVSAPATGAAELIDFNPLRHPILFQQPAYMTIWSAWVEHFPFAYLLTELARPRLLVELGTHAGDSYCAFCQSIAALSLPTRCFAIDTWQGDPHAGFYGDHTLAELRASHDPLYGSFSTLLQSTFDAALPHFADGTIDILHIDGHHAYESVTHDYQTWLAKLSSRGIVLFHDSNVRDKTDFGVWRLWEELSPRFPSFEFHHGSGLGVLLVGREPPPDVLAFVRWASANADLARALFRSLGNRFLWLQQSLRTASTLQRQWGLLSQWREQAGHPPLAPLTFQQSVAAGTRMAKEITRELNVLIEDDLRARAALAAAGVALPTTATSNC